MLTYSVVICTLDRPEDLKRCIMSWLNQKPLPRDIVVVHGRMDGMLEEPLQQLLAGAGVELCYLRMPPSLVRQRNAGIQQAKGDVVFFADDDAVYQDGYAQAILDVYQTDSDCTIGGVQGTIVNTEPSELARWGLSRLFLLTRFNGKGTLQPSAFPAFCDACSNLVQVEVFSGPAMSYRKEVLRVFQFDEALTRYWVGDDFEMAYRVSQHYKLFQVPKARLLHFASPIGRDSMQRLTAMVVVNHFYWFRKHFGVRRRSWAYWIWSEIGLWLVAVLSFILGRGLGRLSGMLQGYRVLYDSFDLHRRKFIHPK